MLKKLVALVVLGVLLQPIYSAAFAASSQLVDPSNFALKLFRAESKKFSSNNLVVSPYSVSLALSMATLGAKGTAKAELQKALGYSSISDAAIEKLTSGLNDSLSEISPASEFAVANAIFAKEGVPLKKQFVDKNQALFSAKLQTINFADKKTSLDLINGWVKKQTQGKIDSILNDIPPAAMMYLINAIYFKGAWDTPFKETATRNTEFILTGGTKKQVRMMHREAWMKYLEGTNFQAVKLPYSDGRMELCVLLPNQGVSINAFVASLDSTTWTDMMDKFDVKEGQLGLPKIKVEYKNELSDSLKQLGIQCAFSQSCADFSGMVDFTKGPLPPVFISRVLHKTYLEIDEAGTTAAAATAVEMAVGSAYVPPTKKFRMICDRPYVIALRDSESGTILFFGKIVNPS